MSILTVQGSAISPRVLKDRNFYTLATTPWVRNPSWLPLTAVESTEQKFRGLIAVFPENNYTAFVAQGAYTVDWGDGTTTNYSSGATALKQYDFNNTNLSNTDAPVTLTDSGDLVQRTNHGYINGMEVRFYNIVTTTGITEGQLYYVINASANSFQISTTTGGSAVALTGDGSATLLPYKQAIVTITPQAGQNLTSLDLNIRHTANGLSEYEAGWLDIEVGSPQFSSSGLIISTYSQFLKRTGTNMCERVAVRNFGSVTDMSYRFFDMKRLREVILASTSGLTSTNYMFGSCQSLQSVPLFNTAAVTNMSGMFSGCYSLQSVPLFNTAAVTNMSGMLQNCYSLQSVPLFNTAAVTNMSAMLQNCYLLQSVPLFNTAAVTNMSAMLQNCYSLQSVPLFSTSAVTDMSQTFQNCYSLQSVPLFNTAAVTNMSQTFNNCYSLLKVPAFNGVAVTNWSYTFQNCFSIKQVDPIRTKTTGTINMQYMFSGCTSLQSVPILDTSAVTDMNNMFNNCGSLLEVPLFNTSAVTAMNSMFQNCYSLEVVPQLNTMSVTNASFMFYNCNSLQSVPLFNTASITNMSYMFAYCRSLQSVPLFNTAAATNMSYMFQLCTSLKSVPLFNTAAVTNMNSMFTDCYSLEYVPQFNTAAVTNMSFMFSYCHALQSVPAFNLNSITLGNLVSFIFFCRSISRVKALPIKSSIGVNYTKLSATGLAEVFENLATVTTSQTISINPTPGMGSIVTKTLNTTAQSTTITTTDTANVVAGMFVTGTGTGITTGVSVTSDVTADTLTLTNHGLSDGNLVAFSSLGTTTGVSAWTIYYVINSTANTFQISLTSGGAAINLTGTNATMGLRYLTYVSSVNSGVSITLSTPAATTQTATSLSFRSLDSGKALLKNWTVSS